MKSEDIAITENTFEFEGVKYNCNHVVRKDKKLIIQQAETTHKEDFERLYKKETLRPDKARLYYDDNNKPLYLMIIYIIDYKDGRCGRYACGGYYPIDSYINDENTNVVYPHPFQMSICW